MADSSLHSGLYAISLLFSYPDRQWASMPIPEGLAVEARLVLEEMRSLDPTALENEYVRLFVNSMPEVPCAPYGSVYLEGTVMGETTLKLSECYRRYGMEPDELADHIAVESEFLAWLHGRAGESAENRKQYDYLLGHLQQWTTGFFSQVEQHDRLGCYRHCARVARGLLSSLPNN